MSSFTRQIVTTSKAPGPWPALSQAVIHNGVVYCSGSLGTDPETKTFVPGTIKDRTTQALKNLENVLIAAGSGSDRILKMTVYVTSMDDVPLLNEAYSAFFSDPKPARACVCVAALARGTDVEIDCIAAL
ncbi:unnamed protein product [Clonostachys rosea]|uniref:Uncharacterized protein n=1 Tax=Bionectria ochroleuca TaxID=29856 RepID=A0ABY6UFK5_BIOOC|nr:unnamed protein product [Clonostachys rosea]